MTVLITWKRLILPNGSSLSLKDGMPGADAIGAAGFHDQVNNHYARIFGHALLLSVMERCREIGVFHLLQRAAKFRVEKRIPLDDPFGRRDLLQEQEHAGA